MNQLRMVLALAFPASALIGAGSAFSQQPMASTSAVQSRTRAIVASFNKTKHEVKEKHGIRMEKYKSVRSEADVKPNPAAYSGVYEVPDLGFSLQLRADRDGSVEGWGYEPVSLEAGVMRRFTLRNGRIEGALLTAGKVYAGGASEPLEGVFITRTDFESPTDKGVTTFGLGVTGISAKPSGVTLDRLFYELKR